MEPLATLHELRARLVEDGQFLPMHMFIIDNLKKEDTMIAGKVKADRGKWAEGLNVKDLTREKAEVAFHAGCRLSYDEGLSKIARAAVTLFKNVGLDIGIMGKEENCCGGRAYEIGYKGEFSKYATNNIEAWTNAGVKTVVTSCSDGYWAFKRLYPAVGCKIEILHTVELIERLIKEGKLKFTKTVPKIVTYHDPCHLGRQGEPYIPWKGVEKRIYGQMLVHEPKKPRFNGAYGIYDPPRTILNSVPGLELVEMERIRENAWCCGAGGGVIDTYPDLSSWTVTERIEEARATGAEAIVTACPWCERNFIDAIEKDGIRMKVYDIMEVVQQAI
jgi:Fe-S oxidoreductase